jgi:ABC-type Fe3+-hydroxamate transport system substrate-binding protein
VRALPRLTLLLAVLAAAALGCQESGFDETKETARPLKVQHILGETKVPGQAEQPITLTIDTLDDTLALDVDPVRAAVPDAQLPAYLRQAGGGVSPMHPVTEADVAALEAVQADLIIGSEGEQGALYEDLSRIAPTVMTDGGGGQWKLNVRLVGEALGRTNDAEKLLTVYDREAGLTRDAIGTAGAGGRGPRVAVVHVDGGELRYAKRDSFAGTILADAGVRQVTSDRQTPDVILLSGAEGTLPRLDARFERVDEAVWWGTGGALAARAALADLEAALAR